MVRRRECRRRPTHGYPRRQAWVAPRSAVSLLVAGGLSAGDTPVPIPNTVVKPCRADGTAGETRWESTTLPASIQAHIPSRGVGFLGVPIHSRQRRPLPTVPRRPAAARGRVGGLALLVRVALRWSPRWTLVSDAMNSLTGARRAVEGAAAVPGPVCHPLVPHAIFRA